MNKGYHYYATLTAAHLAGYTLDEAVIIAHAAQLVDMCTKTYLLSLGGPVSAATTQANVELVSVRLDVVGRQDITRIWSSFHFLPYDLYAKAPWGPRSYREKYALICAPNGPLVSDVVELARGKGLEAAGICCHTVADTWSHAFFAGTPSLAINNVASAELVELVEEGDGYATRRVTFVHRPAGSDDLVRNVYTQSMFSVEENSVMNLGHGRCGHLPDYSFMRYRYLPSWGNYRAVVKDNPRSFYLALSQMVHVLRYLHGEIGAFERETYEDEILAPYAADVEALLNTRTLDEGPLWQRLTDEIVGRQTPAFDRAPLDREYLACSAKAREQTMLGRFFRHAMAQKSLVTNRVWKSGNRLCGRSIEMGEGLFGVLADYRALIEGGGV